MRQGRGREAFHTWLTQAGEAERAFVYACMATPRFMTTELRLGAEGRLDMRRAESVADRLSGGQFRLMGLIRGFALLRDTTSSEILEEGIRLLLVA